MSFGLSQLSQNAVVYVRVYGKIKELNIQCSGRFPPVALVSIERSVSMSTLHVRVLFIL